MKTQLQGHRNNKIEAASILYLADLKVAKVSKKSSKNRPPSNHFKAVIINKVHLPITNALVQ